MKNSKAIKLMKYARTLEFKKQSQFLYRQGGRNKDAVDELHKVLGLWAQDPSQDPIGQLLQRTKTKEDRLNNCEKFVILERYRLITQRVGNLRTMRFIANHDGSENWLNRSSKEDITVDENGVLHTVKISNIVDINNRDNEFEFTKDDKNWVMEEITNLREGGWLSATKMKVANEMWRKYD